MSDNTQVVPVSANLPVAMQEALRQQAGAMTQRIQSAGGDKISLTKDKHFKLPDGTKHPGPLSVVILDFLSTNKFFDKPYKEGEITAPACFAIGNDPTALVPSPHSPDIQADSCSVCPNNKFGSKGNGKACGNHRLLVVRAGVGDDALDKNAPKFTLQISPTGVKAFDGYVGSIRAPFGPPITVITDIFFDKDSEHQSLRFGNPQHNPNIELHFPEQAVARDRLEQEPDVSAYEAPKKKAAKK